MKKIIFFVRLLLYLWAGMGFGRLVGQQVKDITILQPNRTTTLDWSCQLISWTLDAPGVQFLRCDISTDFGDTWWRADYHEEPGVPDGWVYNDGYLTFNPPHCWSSTAYIRLTNALDPEDFKISEPFPITSPTPESLTLTQPRTGEAFTAGTGMELKWESNYYSYYDVKIEYSLNGGVDWHTIQQETENDGYYMWRIPSGLQSSNCYIHIHHRQNGVTFESIVGPISIQPSQWGTHFVDASLNAGVDLTGMYRCASWIDLNGDDAIDLFVTGADGFPNVLYLNDGDGTFSRSALQANIETLGSFNRAGVFGDINDDGLPDLYLGEGSDFGDKLFLNTGNGNFNDITSQAGIVSNTVETNGVAYLDYDLDGDLDIYVCKGGIQNILFRNNGNLTFTNVATDAGVAGSASAVSLAVAVGDYDRDGDSDLYVVNSNPNSNVLYMNNGNGTFTEMMYFNLALAGYNSRTAEWADFNTDGLPDLYVTRRFNSNVMFRYNYDGTFTDVTQQSQVGNPGESVVMTTGDFDCDGRVDICIGNRSSLGNEEIVLYLQNGEDSFDEIDDLSGLTPVSEPRGIAVGDYDGDGDPDIFVTSYGGSSRLFENKIIDENRNHWIKVRLEGVRSNRDAIGSRVMLYSEGRWQMREVQVGTGYGNQNSNELEFGLGGNDRAESMAIFWPSGLRHTFTDLMADSVYKIPEIADSVINDIEGTLTLTSPEGGTVYQTEDAGEIFWQSTGEIDNVRLEYSTDGGQNWHDITITENDGVYDWSIPRSVHSDSCLIRISDAEDGIPVDTSDMFTIEIPTVPLSWEVSSDVQAGFPFWITLDLGDASHVVYSFKEARATIQVSSHQFLEVLQDSIDLGPIWGNNPVMDVQIDTQQGEMTLELQRAAEEGGFDGFGRVVELWLKPDMNIPPGTEIVIQFEDVALEDTAGVLIPVETTSISITVANAGITVWPGDTDNDGVVNQEDVLPIGLHWGMEGNNREGGSVDWIGQGCLAWTDESVTYSDVNGDGSINMADLNVVLQNWDSTHEGGTPVLPFGEMLTNVRVCIRVADHTPYEPFYVDLDVEDGAPVFGVALNFFYDNDKVEIDSVVLGSLWGDETLFLYRDVPVDGKTGIGISQKRDQATGANTGILARVWMRVRNGVPLNTPVVFRLDDVEAINSNGERLVVSVQNSGFLTGVEQTGNNAPVVFHLYPSFPNPFNPSTEISYRIPQDVRIVLHIYDVRGQKVRTLVDERKKKGVHSVVWDAKDDNGRTVSSGVYVYQIIAGRHTSTQKCMLMK